MKKPRMHQGLFQSFIVGNRQFPATGFAAAGQRFAAILRFHTCAETVFVFAHPARRLVCAFHDRVL